MSQTILLVDYEPRTATRVQESLAALDCQLVTAKDVDSAVAACAKVEPRVVLITSVLPKVKVEDAITQLRAMAGLRNTPFVILASGYTGVNPKDDAAKLGAQGLVSKPFSNDELLAAVKATLQTPRPQQPSSDSRVDLLEALRRSAGLPPGPGTVTSQDLFGDLFADESETTAADTQRIVVQPTVKPVAARPEPRAGDTQPMPVAEKRPTATPAPEPPRAVRPVEPDTAVERVVQSTVASVKEQVERSARPKPAGGPSVDELLSQTLSGLEPIPARRRPEPPAPAAAPPPPPPPPPAVKPPPPPRVEPPIVELPAKRKAVPPPEPAPAAPLPQGAPFGHYELMELIATGGMAEVYKARMRGVEGFQKIVAIKRILPHLTDNDDFVTMFIDEAKLAAQLQHPNIIHIYDLGKIERSYYIAMEYIDGKDLRSILRTLEEKGRRLPLGLALYIGSRLAAALDYAHRKKDLQGKAMVLVHRDVSPQNVLISFDGDIKLCDFGIAKAASKASHTRAGALKGKLQYMSPEQAWGKDLDNRSDIFSLGLVLYEMVTGRKAFQGDSELSILEQVRVPQLEPPRTIDPTVPSDVAQVIMKALRDKREERYQTAADFEAALDDLIQALRPSPGASDLGHFLAQLQGRDKAPLPAPPVAHPEPPAKVVKPKVEAPPVAEPIKAPPVVVEAPAPPPVAAIPVEVPVAEAPARKSPAGLLAAVAAVVALAAVVGALYFGRKPATGGPEAAATPAPETVELARQIVEQEMARRQQELLGQPGGGEAAVTPAAPAPAAAAPAVAPQAPAAVPTRAAAPPAAAPTARPTPAAAAVPVQPTAVPTAEPEPTAVPTAVPAPVEAPTRPPLVAQAPTVREGDLVDASTSGLVPPQPLSNPKASYPPLAARQRVGGTVILEVLVNENGRVDDVKVLRGVKPDLGLDAAAVAAVRTWRFTPATLDGVRVKTRITQVIPFRP